LTVIWLQVRVPVLSEQITVVEPNVSTLGSFLINAFFLMSLFTPSAREIVTTAGRPSGIAATARAMLARSRSITSISVRTRPEMNTVTAIPMTSQPRNFPSSSSFFWSGVCVFFVVWTSFAIFPISVCIPVLITIAFPRPAEMEVPEKTMLCWSAIPFFDSTRVSSFELGVDSPVNAASSVLSSMTSMSLASAGILVPSSS